MWYKDFIINIRNIKCFLIEKLKDFIIKILIKMKIKRIVLKGLNKVILIVKIFWKEKVVYMKGEKI